MSGKQGNKRSQDSRSSSAPPSKRPTIRIPRGTSENHNPNLEETKQLGQQLVQSSTMFLPRGPLKPQLDLKETDWSEDDVECRNEKKKEKHLEKALEIYNQELRDHQSEAKRKIETMLELKNPPTPWNDDSEFALKEKQIQTKIKIDKELHGYYKRDIRGTMDSGILDFLMRNLRYQFNHKKGSKIPFSKSLLSHLQQAKYDPPQIRTSLATIGDIIGKPDIYFCDVAQSTLNSFKKELVYEYIAKNYVDEQKYPDLAKFTKKAETEKYVIKCDCCKKGNKPIVPCWQNPNCQCFKVNRSLQKLQYQTNEGHREMTSFHTFHPKLVSDVDYSHTIGFACSELCGCKGRCDNNVTLIPEKELYPLEVFRRNEVIGFGVRTMAAIPVGTLVVEFTGEIMDYDVIESKSADDDYSFALSTHYKESIKKFQEGDSRWDGKFKEELRRQLATQWFINPKRKGNIGRLLCHSCLPNMSMVQVYQKGFSPAHCRLFLATQKDVFPGVELTWNYGTAFVKENFKNKCMCGTIGCKNTPEYNQISKLSESTIKSVFALQHHNGFQKFKKVRCDAAKVEKSDE